MVCPPYNVSILVNKEERGVSLPDPDLVSNITTNFTLHKR